MSLIKSHYWRLSSENVEIGWSRNASFFFFFGAKVRCCGEFSRHTVIGSHLEAERITVHTGINSIPEILSKVLKQDLRSALDTVKISLHNVFIFASTPTCGRWMVFQEADQISSDIWFVALALCWVLGAFLWLMPHKCYLLTVTSITIFGVL